jgi:dTDP-4-dehydrorhamnose 3,5-epimerase-like enzyme
MKKTTLDDVLFYNMRTVIEDDGNLVPIESNRDLPFPIKRVFYVYGVRDKDVRGEHAHHKTKQLLICISGKIEVLCDDGKNKRKYLLESPQQGLLIPEMIWDEQKYITDDAVMLVVSNTNYDTNDYIHDYDKFVEIKRNERNK